MGHEEGFICLAGSLEGAVVAYGKDVVRPSRVAGKCGTARTASAGIGAAQCFVLGQFGAAAVGRFGLRFLRLGRSRERGGACSRMRYFAQDSGGAPIAVRGFEREASIL